MKTELFKTANVQASFICEAMLDHAADDGTIYNKIIVTIVKRTALNKAESTVKHFVDITPAKVIFHDLWDGTLTDEHKEFKKSNGTERALNIKSHNDGYRFAVMNKPARGESQSLYFDLNRFQVRCLSRAVLDHLSAWEIAKALRPPPPKWKTEDLL